VEAPERETRSGAGTVGKQQTQCRALEGRHRIFLCRSACGCAPAFGREVGVLVHVYPRRCHVTGRFAHGDLALPWANLSSRLRRSGHGHVNPGTSRASLFRPCQDLVFAGWAVFTAPVGVAMVKKRPACPRYCVR
jgi:hypothetical protein